MIDSVPPMQLMADTGKSSEEDDDDVDITEAELNALPFSDQDDDSDQGLYNTGWFKKQFSPCLLGFW